jgi:hypothetical protein
MDMLSSLPVGGDPWTLHLECLNMGNLRKVSGAVCTQVKAGTTKPQLVEILVKQCRRGLKVPEIFASLMTTFPLKIGTLLFVLFSAWLGSCLVLSHILSYFLCLPSLSQSRMAGVKRLSKTLLLERLLGLGQ